MDPNNEQQQAYAFPLLKNETILQCMAELGVELAQAELTEPHRHKDRVKAVFTLLLEFGLGLTEQDLSDPSPGVLEWTTSLNYPELHEESVVETKFLRECQRLMKICGILDFGWKDIGAPSSKRFRRQLSGAINYIRFREDKQQVYDELYSQYDELKEGLRRVNEENDQLNVQLEEARLQAAKDFKEQEQVEAECAEIETEIAQQNKLQSSIRLQTTELKKKANDLKDEVANVSLAIQELETEKRRLSAQLVSSPERIKRERREAEERLGRERIALQDSEKLMSAAKEKVAAVEKAVDFMGTATKLVEKLSTEAEKENSLVREVATVRESVAAKRHQVAAVRSEIQGLQDQSAQRAEELQGLRAYGRIRLAEMDEKLNRLKVEQREAEKERQDGYERLEACEADVRALEKTVEKEKMDGKEQMQGILRAFEQLDQAMGHRAEKIRLALQAE